MTHGSIIMYVLKLLVCVYYDHESHQLHELLAFVNFMNFVYFVTTVYIKQANYNQFEVAIPSLESCLSGGKGRDLLQ